MENVTGIKKKGGNLSCMCHPQTRAFIVCIFTHTHIVHMHSWAESLSTDHICPSSWGSVMATPAASPRLSHQILLVGSIICLAVWVPVNCVPGDFSLIGDGRHWAEASPASTAAVWETGRGAAQMWESGANRRYGWFRRRPCLLFHLFLGGRSRPLIWLRVQHLAFVPEMKNCKENKTQGEMKKKLGERPEPQREIHRPNTDWLFYSISVTGFICLSLQVSSTVCFY